MERMKKDHVLQIKQKDDFIKVLSRKSVKPSTEVKRVVTRASLRPKAAADGGELIRTPNNRYLSPAQPAKKRTFWDIATANSPTVATFNGRKTRSSVLSEHEKAAPSLLLQVQLFLV